MDSTGVNIDRLEVDLGVEGLILPVIGGVRAG
jgi:hypothetical protein